MRRIIFLIFAIASILGMMTTNVFSQEITVRFTGQLNGNDYCQLDSVVITNLTRNWSETVEYPDTIIVFGSTVGSNINIVAEQGLGQNIPNPFDCETRVELALPQSEDVRMQLLDVAGKIYAEYNGTLDAGMHIFDISAANPQTYLLNAMVGNRQYSIRMVNVGSGCGCSIKYAGKSNGIEAKLTTTNEFRTGDNMRYVGYSTIGGEIVESAAIEQVQTMSEDAILNFTSCLDIYYGIDTHTVCDSYTWIDGVIYTESTEEPTFTLTNAEGCDSIVTLHLTINQSNTGVDEQTAYGSYEWIDGITYTESTNEPTYTLTNMAGCDSVVTLHLTINNVALDVETLDAADVTGATASLSGEITIEVGSVIIEKGFFYGIDENNLISHVIADSNFNVTLTDLMVNTTYYFRAYVTSSDDTIYGEIRSFRTRGNTLNEFEFVDLGLPSGKSWATCNVGANSPEEFGNYYAWGETSVKDEYTWDNYIYGSATYDEVYQSYTDVHITKYNNVSSWGTVDNIYTLEDSDDVANLTMGTGWRIPTQEEITELKDNCTWTWTTINDVYGYLITGANENSIFIPAARAGGSSSSQNEYGAYWSSSLNEESLSYGLGAAAAYYLYFNSSNIDVYKTYRVNGLSIRPICNENPESPHLPTVTTTAVNTITDVSAFSGGNITYDGGATITARGVCWSSSQYPTISDNHTLDGICYGNFISSITGLTAGQTYYARAYATNRAGTAYGEQFCFTTSSVHNEDGGTLNEHEYVNLGLPSGTLWATCNVGADIPTDFGNYFSWAETTSKNRYEESNYSLYYNNHYTRYNAFDNMIQLQFSDDAATVNWGYGWRTPTYEEINELVTLCTWSWTTINPTNNINGYQVTGPNGNSIFLPAAGNYYEVNITWFGTAGCYWSSTLKDTDSYSYVWSLYFNSEGSNTSNSWRVQGLSVRPVRQ